MPPLLHRPLRLCLWLILGLLLTLLWSSGTIVPTQAQTIPPLYQAGETAYEEGDYESAIASWQQLLDTTPDPSHRVTLLNNLSLAHQNLQNWQAAEQTIIASLNSQNYDLQQQRWPANPDDPELLARSLDIYGQLAYRQGDMTSAVLGWQQSERYYRAAGVAQLPALAANQIYQAQALQVLGRHLEAQQRLLAVQASLQQQSAQVPGKTQVSLWLSIGRAQRLIGKLTESMATLEQGIALAQDYDPAQLSALYIEQGNTQRLLAQRHYTTGEQDSLRQSVAVVTEAYTLALALATSPWEASVARLNQLSFLANQARWGLTNTLRTAEPLRADLQADLENLPLDQGTITARTKFTAALVNLHKAGIGAAISPADLLQFSAATIQYAESLGNHRLRSLAWGSLGSVYEEFADNRPQNLADALQATRQALAASGQNRTPEITYRWLWQLGRILHQQGQTEEAISAYDAAVGAIAEARKALLPINSEVQFSFRDDVEPVYRQYIDLLTFQDTVDNLNKSIDVIDALQLSELENFLGCDLSASVRIDQNLDEVDPNAVFVYPIILENRLEVIVKVPGQPLTHFSTLVSRAEVEHRLKAISDSIRYRSLSRPDLETVYAWLIPPLEPYLMTTDGSTKTLVMPLDSYFRNVPLAALVDPSTGEYLVEKPYALAILPTAQLFDLSPFQAQQQQYLLAGISEPLSVPDGPNFQPLNFDGELNAISRAPRLTQLFNQEVTRENIARADNAQVIHLITHGKFSSNPEETYLLAYGQESGVGDLIKAREINEVFGLGGNNPNRQLNLLFLAACNTAEGDDRAVLGLAGMAVRARAAAAISSLWRVSDQHIAKLAEVFYEQLMEQGVTKAEALHRAQQQMVSDREHQNLYDWAPFVVVGNWR